MPITAVVGTQWGDEGKGRLIDFLSAKSGIVARYAGGPNAGHTVIIKDMQCILHQIPSGIFCPNTVCIVGNGLVLDLLDLKKELEEIKQKGVNYVRPERFSGRSTNSFIKNIAWARKAIFSFSYMPLEWVFYLASICVLVSLLAVVLYLILYFLIPDAPKGFLTILIAVLFIGSVQLVVLSIISEYLRRIFEEVKSRPTSIVREVINNHKK